MNNYLFVFLLVVATGSLLADDFKTIEGKEYKNVTVSRVEPDGIVLTSSSGISKVYFTELPKGVQEHFHYDAARAAAYSAEQNAKQELLRKQNEQQRAIAAAKALASRQAAAAARHTAIAPSRTVTPVPPQQSRELAAAKAQTEVMEAEARGDSYGAELARIKADYEPRIRAAAQAGNKELADELRKQAKMKITEALARRLP